MGKSTDKTSLGDRCKQYEELTESKISKENYIIIRLDGHGFSKYTKGLAKPFDKNFSEAMTKVCEELLSEFPSASYIYTQSDEITMILQPMYTKETNNQMYAGRIQKLASLTAGFTSTMFNKYYEHPKGKLGYFDARVFSVPSKEEAYNMVMWRCRDAVKNSKNVYAQTYCSHKSLLNKTSQEQIDYCLEKTGLDWNTIEDKYKYGISVYRKIVEKPVKEEFKAYTKRDTVKRRVTINKAVNLASFDDELVRLVTTTVSKKDK